MAAEAAGTDDNFSVDNRPIECCYGAGSYACLQENTIKYKVNKSTKAKVRTYTYQANNYIGQDF